MGRFTSAVVSSMVCVVLLIGAVVGGPPVRTAPYESAPYQPLTADAPLTRIAIVGDSYTNGTAIGGQGQRAWPVRAARILARQGMPIDDDVAAEGRAGFVVRGDHGSIFGDLTTRAVKPDDAVVVFFGSRNDQGVDPNVLGSMAYAAFSSARGIAPAARLLVIGPPWPTADVPPAILQIRDTLAFQALLLGATFVDPIAARWFVDRPELIGRDGVHPTDAGHVYLAEEIAPLIGGQLPRSA